MWNYKWPYYYLYILQSQVLSLASTTDTKLRPLSSYHWEDSQNAFDCHVYIDIHVCAANQEENDKIMKSLNSKENKCYTVLINLKWTSTQLIFLTMLYLYWFELKVFFWLECRVETAINKPILWLILLLLSLLLCWFSPVSVLSLSFTISGSWLEAHCSTQGRHSAAVVSTVASQQEVPHRRSFCVDCISCSL